MKRIVVSISQNQTFKASAAFIVFSNILVANKYANGMHWMNGFAYATHGLLQFLLTVLTIVTLFAALIFGLRDAFRYLPQMNPIVGLVVKVTLFIVFGFVLTEFSRTIFMFLSNVSGLNPLLDTTLKPHSVALDWFLLRSNSTLRVDALDFVH